MYKLDVDIHEILYNQFCKDKKLFLFISFHNSPNIKNYLDDIQI